MLLCQTMLYTDKFQIRYKDFYIKTTIKFRINYMEEISTKVNVKEMKVIKCHTLLLFYIYVSFRSIVCP